jgi:ArsR family transcriptional regulator
MNNPEELFFLLSDETRLRCILLLQKENELCVCELTHVIEVSQPKISRHLALLRSSGLVLDERREQWVYYRLNGKIKPWIHKIIVSISKELQGLDPYFSDLKKLHKLKNSIS